MKSIKSIHIESQNIVFFFKKISEEIGIERLIKLSLTIQLKIFLPAWYPDLLSLCSGQGRHQKYFSEAVKEYTSKRLEGILHVTCMLS